jgi:hypothetical protein
MEKNIYKNKNIHKDEQRDLPNSPLIEEENIFSNPTEKKEKHHVEVVKLFESAIGKLDNMEKQANDQKKQIVVNLAKVLEDKIPIDTICMKIVDHLHGRVSPRFIRECLDDKYKQKVRVENARKQKLQEDVKLAAVPPLNEEENKEIMMVNVDGRTRILHNEEDVEPPTDTSDSTGNTINPILDQSEQEQKLNKQDVPEFIEGSEFGDLLLENPDQIEDVENLSHLVDSGKIVSTAYENKHNINTTSEVLNFEFSVYYRDLQKYMASLFQKSGDNGNVWLNGKIDRKTGVVISLNFGRMNQHQH